MPFPATAGLPRTRSLHRVRSRRGWWLAMLVAVGANLAVVVLLGQVSRLAQAPSPARLTVYRLNRLEPDPSPPPEIRETPAEEAAAEAILPALPLLDLPLASVAGPALPAIGALDLPAELPLVMPAVTALVPMDDVAVAPALPTAGVDSPATRQGAFDLERHYPRAARLRGLAGTSRIRSHIDAHGRVTAVEVLDSQPPGVFDQAAERLGRAQRYEPARSAGQAVPTSQDTVIEWKLQ